jgi:hypothetical protein
LSRLGSAKRQASRVASRGGAPGEGQGQPGSTGRRDGQSGSARGKDGDKSGGEQGKDGRGSAQEKGKQGGSEKGKDGRGDSGRGKSGRDQKGGEAGKTEKAGEQGQEGQKGQKANSSGGSSAARRLASLTEPLRKVAPVLKWVVFGVLALVVVLFVLRGALRFLANFTDWARRLLEAWRNFWARLFGGRPRAEGERAGAGEEGGPRPEPEQPWRDFVNRFEGGLASQRTAQELVRYTFAAVQAWARERDLGRQPGETPEEFAARVGAEVPALEAELRQFWQRLERVAAQPLSA